MTRLQFLACSSPSSTCRLVFTTSKGDVTMEATWQKQETLIIYCYTTFCLQANQSFRVCCQTHRTWRSSGHEGDGESGLPGFVPLSQKALAPLIVVPVHCWEGHIPKQSGPQTPPQRQPALRLHRWADAGGKLSVRLFLGLQLGADELQGADHRCRPHWEDDEMLHTNIML